MLWGKFISRTAVFFLMLLLMTAGLTANIQTKAYGAETSPDILITEIMPMSQLSDDAYEYIELYNSTENNINIKDYKFAYPNIDINISKTIPSKGVLVLCTRSATTLENFNKFYNTSLTEDKYLALPFAYEALENNGGQCVTLAKDDGTVISSAKYDRLDFDVKKSATYKYPADGFYMTLLGKRQAPGPGTVAAEQVPYEGVNVTGITLNNETVNMEVNQSLTLVPTISPSTATNKSVTWSSSATKIAVVNQNGIVTAKSEGVCIITAKTVDGGFMASCAVIVKRIPVTGITIDKSNISIYKGNAVAIGAAVLPANATNRSVTWYSDNLIIASVDQNGVVVGRTPGTAVVTVRTADGGYTASCKVTVIEASSYIPVTGISLNKTTVTIDTGKAVAIEAYVKPLNATNKRVIWSSNNSNIVQVDQNGVIYGKAAGSVLITAKTEDNGYTASCAVTVKSRPEESYEVKGVRLNRHMLFLNEGEHEDLDASVFPCDAVNKNVTWASDNTYAASVDSNGKVTGVHDGIAVITVKTVEGSYADRCVVVVGDYRFDDCRDVIDMWMNRFMVNIFSGHTEKLNVRISSYKPYNKRIIWSTSNSRVATVSDDGKVSGHESGMAVITAATEDGSYKASCYVYVSDKNNKGKRRGWNWGWNWDWSFNYWR